jgi:type IV secretory pathway VirB2 component (pilin)
MEMLASVLAVGVATLVGVAPGPSLPSSPDTSSLPGSNVLQGLTNGVEGWARVAALAGIVVGAVIWAFGHYSQNYQQAFNGRRGVMVSGLAALLIGGAPHLVDAFEHMGTTIH